MGKPSATPGVRYLCRGRWGNSRNDLQVHRKPDSICGSCGLLYEERPERAKTQDYFDDSSRWRSDLLARFVAIRSDANSLFQNPAAHSSGFVWAGIKRYSLS